MDGWKFQQATILFCSPANTTSTIAGLWQTPTWHCITSTTRDDDDDDYHAIIIFIQDARNNTSSNSDNEYSWRVSIIKVNLKKQSPAMLANSAMSQQSIPTVCPRAFAIDFWWGQMGKTLHGSELFIPWGHETVFPTVFFLSHCLCAPAWRVWGIIQQHNIQ